MVESPGDQPIVGTCMQMCPDSEIQRRSKTNRLHRLEATRDSLSTRKLEADHNRAVKEFERTAMGSLKVDTSRIRPVAVLEQTVSYLIDEILPVTSLAYNSVYDFVFDRFRAVRQELVMQQIDGGPKIRMLEKMVLFHVYSAFQMCEMEYRCFDPVINGQHLSECLNILMSQYDAYQSRDVGPAHQEESMCRRAVFEAIYLMHNLLSERAVARFGSLPPVVARDPTARQAFRLAVAYHTGNCFKVLKMLPQLPVFSLMSLVPHIPAIQVRYLNIMASAFGSSAPPVPVKYLVRVLCPFENYRNAEQYVLSLCQSFDATILRSEVRFAKSKKEDVMLTAILRSVSHRMWSRLEERLSNESISDLINFTCPPETHISSS